MKTYIVHWKSKRIPAHTGVATVKATSKGDAAAKVARKFKAEISFIA